MMSTPQPITNSSVPGGLFNSAGAWDHTAPELPTPSHDVAVSESVVTQDPDLDLVQGLRRGEDTAFAMLLDRYHSRLLRLADAFVPSRAVAEEVVQETWLVVWEGIHRFKGESSFKTWLYKILTNRAKSKGIRERRYVPFPDAAHASNSDSDSQGDPDRLPSSHISSNDSEDWQTTHEEHTPERLLLSKEGLAQLERAIHALPETQRQMILLRDVEGMEPEDICALLHLTPGNQRIILHRARVKVRNALQHYLQGSSMTK